MNSTSSTCHFLSYNDLMRSITNCKTDTFQPIVSDETLFYFQVIVNVFANGFISIFGIVANAFNIIVFIRQGIFTESGTAGIFGLAVSDLCCVVSMLWLCVIEAVVLANPSNLSWDPSAVKTTTAFWPHLMFAQVTRMVTAFVAFERCVCVMFPFKVKTLLNPQRSITIISGTFLAIGLCFLPHFIAFQLRHFKDPSTNTTRFAMVVNHHFQSIALDKMIYVTGYTVNLLAVIIVFVSTIITAIRINLSKAWRESMAAGGSSKSDKASSKPADNSTSNNNNNNKEMSKSKMRKEVKLVRMIIIISIIFLICYIPLFAYLVMITANKELGLRGKYKNFSRVMYSFYFLMETINSSINIIVYFKMSTRYKEDLRHLLGLKGK